MTNPWRDAKMSHYPSISAGEEVFPEMQGYKMACCDCGLVHTMDFRIVEVQGNTGDVFHTVEPDNADRLRVVLTADRDEEETEAVRGARGLSDDPRLDSLVSAMVEAYPLVAIAHAINRVSPGLRSVLAAATASLVQELDQ